MEGEAHLGWGEDYSGRAPFSLLRGDWTAGEGREHAAPVRSGVRTGRVTPGRWSLHLSQSLLRFLPVSNGGFRIPGLACLSPGMLLDIYT